MSITQIIAVLILIALLIGFFWWQFSKRKKRNASEFTAAWRTILLEKVEFYENLSAPDKTRFEQGILKLLDEVRITGVDIEVNDTDRLLVASSAVIPLFGFPGWNYNKLTEVILYEGAFNSDYQTSEGEAQNILGMVGGGSMNSTMILSKPALYEGFERHGNRHHVGIHEFVHLLDRADGASDGVPEMLLQQPFLIPWMKLIHQEIKAIQEGESDINPYGGTNEAEFLSVVSEYFFKQPQLLEKHHPELFAMLSKVFKQDLR